MKKRTKKLLGSIFRYLSATVTTAVLFYVLLALLFSTEEEKKRGPFGGRPDGCGCHQ